MKLFSRSRPWSALGLLVMVVCSTSAAELREGIGYARRGERELKLDLALPLVEGRMRPGIVCIHGGGWQGGDRKSYHGFLKTVADLGYVAATVEYRFTDVAPWPAQIEDVREALEWLVKHADEYGLDRERIGLMGDSAGGHLSLMLGLMPTELKEGLRVRGIVNLYGPTDMRDLETYAHVRGLFEALVGGKLEEKLDVLADLSPIRYVNRTDPPVLTFHGDQDEIVPIQQAEVLHAALTQAQVPNHFETLRGVGHGLGDQQERAHRRLRRFFDAYLRGGGMPLVTHEDFENGAGRWQLTDPTAWELVSNEGRSFFSLKKDQSDYQPKVRSPFNIALLREVEVGDFVLDVDFRSTKAPYGHQSLCLFFGHQDPSHFYYVHFGRRADAHANSIFIVNDEPRVSIAQERTEGTDWSRGWHRARVRREVGTGLIEVFFDDMEQPVMRAVDKTFGRGRVGVGSFDDIGDFDSIRLWGR